MEIFMNKFLFGVLAIGAFLSCAGFCISDANAQELLPTLEKGQVLVTLSAQDQMDADQDMLVAGLRIEVEDANPLIVQDKINRAMKSAVEMLKENKDFEVSTGQYYVHSYYPNSRSKISFSSEEQKEQLIWKGSQTVDFKSKDSQALLEAVGKVQAMGFAMNQLSYMLSPEKAESYKDQLLVGALKKIQDKAALVAKTLGKSGFDIVDMNIDGSYMPSPMPMMRGVQMEMMSTSPASVSAPMAEPGKSIVNLNVNARVILQP